jgi:Coenzyme PQQ synthesis protein D (PqqD)
VLPYPDRIEIIMGTPLSLESIIVANTEQVSQALEGETFILSLKNSAYYGLDPIGTHLWTLLRAPRRVSQLRDALVTEYEIEAEQCERDLLELLENMRVEGLIDVRCNTVR